MTDRTYCPMCDTLVLNGSNHKCTIPEDKPMFKCECQECGEEFECSNENASLCDDCIDEAEYDDSEYEE